MERKIHLKRLIDDSLNNDSFTAKDLNNSYNMKGYSVAYWIEKGIIRKCDRNQYALGSEGCRLGIFEALKCNDYQTFFARLEQLSALSENENESNFYLYLASLSIDLPERLAMKIASFSRKDLIDSESRLDIIIQQIYSGQIVDGYRFFCDYLEGRKYTTRDQILKNLMDRMFSEFKNQLQKLTRAINEDRYYSVKILLEKKKKFGSLSDSDEVMLLACKLSEAMERFRVLPASLDRVSNSFIECMFSGDMEKILSIHKEEDPLTIVYGTINRSKPYVSKILKRTVDKKNDLIKSAQQNGEVLLQLSVKDILFLMDVIDTVLDGKKDEAYLLLNKYLEEKGLVQYEDLLSNAIRRGIEEEDYTFYIAFKAMAIITSKRVNRLSFFEELAKSPHGNAKYVYSKKDATRTK